MEPLSVGVHSVFTQAKLQPAQSIAVFGCGPVGLLCMAVAKAIGASRIIAVDIVQSRLDFAKTYAATDGFRPPPFQEGESKMVYSQRSADLFRTTLGVEDRGNKAIDVVIDASGAEVSIQTGILIAKVGGTFVQVSLSLCQLVSSLPYHRSAWASQKLSCPSLLYLQRNSSSKVLSAMAYVLPEHMSYRR
jgi:D-xylulose reductase